LNFREEKRKLASLIWFNFSIFYYEIIKSIMNDFIGLIWLGLKQNNKPNHLIDMD
jgi:hypothetical protein